MSGRRGEETASPPASGFGSIFVSSPVPVALPPRLARLDRRRSAMPVTVPFAAPVAEAGHRAQAAAFTGEPSRGEFGGGGGGASSIGGDSSDGIGYGGGIDGSVAFPGGVAEVSGACLDLAALGGCRTTVLEDHPLASTFGLVALLLANATLCGPPLPPAAATGGGGGGGSGGLGSRFDFARSEGGDGGGGGAHAVAVRDPATCRRLGLEPPLSWRAGTGACLPGDPRRGVDKGAKRRRAELMSTAVVL